MLGRDRRGSLWCQPDPEQGYAQALEQARMQAIQSVAGVQMQSETLLMESVQGGDYSRLFSEINNLISYGQIVDEKYTRSMEHYQPDPTSTPIPLYRVHLRALVKMEKGRADPNFQLELTLNRHTFIAGRDTMVIALRSNQDCFVTLFNIVPQTDSVYVLLPNDKTPTFPLKAGVERIIPEPAWGTSIRLFPLAGHDQHGEAMLAIATRSHIDFMAGRLLGGLALGKQAALTELTRWLVTIPIEERATDFRQYQVRRK